MKTEYALIIAKYRCPHCDEIGEDYPKSSIFKNGYTFECPYCEEKFKMKAMT